jgi:hypothetical protein
MTEFSAVLIVARIGPILDLSLNGDLGWIFSPTPSDFRRNAIKKDVRKFASISARGKIGGLNFQASSCRRRDVLKSELISKPAAS